MRAIDREKDGVPAWANYAAQDANGAVVVYERKPQWFPEFGEWFVAEGYSGRMCTLFVDKCACPPETTLVELPA